MCKGVVGDRSYHTQHHYIDLKGAMIKYVDNRTITLMHHIIVPKTDFHMHCTLFI